MHRTTASYKVTHGLCKTMYGMLVNKLKETTPFSLNMEEATSSNFLKVFFVLVSYIQNSKFCYCGAFGRFESEYLFNELKALFVRLDLTLENLMAILSDSASVMCGTNSGLEVQVQEIAPH